MKKIIGISFDTDDLDDDNSFLIMILKKIDKDMKWRVDCFTACEDYLNSEIKEYLSIKELEKILSESKKAMFIRIMGKNINGKHKIIRTRSNGERTINAHKLNVKSINLLKHFFVLNHNKTLYGNLKFLILIFCVSHAHKSLR